MCRFELRSLVRFSPASPQARQKPAGLVPARGALTFDAKSTTAKATSRSIDLAGR
jgi:hypothetical protein